MHIQRSAPLSYLLPLALIRGTSAGEKRKRIMEPERVKFRPCWKNKSGRRGKRHRRCRWENNHKTDSFSVPPLAAAKQQIQE